MGQTVSVWWRITWRATVGGMLLALIAGAIARVITGARRVNVLGHYDPGLTQRAARIAGMGVSIPVIMGSNLVVIRMALQKKYRGFRLAVIPT